MLKLKTQNAKRIINLVLTTSDLVLTKSDLVLTFVRQLAD